jgi:SAM-dependent methyltransferase
MLKLIEKRYRSIFPKRIKNYKFFQAFLKDKSGLEIGGPSYAFTDKGYLPLYPTMLSLDGCNFSTNTVWEGELREGLTYHYGDKKGYQYISDGTKLDMIPNEKYDAILSCHSLEHFANPIKALTEWKRVLINNGFMVLILPHKDQTFDHKRPVTTLEHLINDFENNIAEDDTTHFNEIIDLHDISRDPGIVDLENLKKRTLDNFNNRCVHHHVFNTPLIIKLCNHLQFEICDVQHFNPFNIVLLLKKNNNIANNSKFLDPENILYKKVNFPSDNIW